MARASLRVANTNNAAAETLAENRIVHDDDRTT